MNQTISTATLQPIYNGRQLKRADSTKVPTPSLGDGKPNSLDLDQVHLDIECHRSRSQRLRVAPVLLICRSGKRSLETGEGLNKEDIADVLKVFKSFDGETDH
ncbi:MAG: hypothetical protein V3R65_09440 [Acidiferrobacterales bacterium]